MSSLLSLEFALKSLSKIHPSKVQRRYDIDYELQANNKEYGASYCLIAAEWKHIRLKTWDGSILLSLNRSSIRVTSFGP
jgi:hypothetical protein